MKKEYCHHCNSEQVFKTVKTGDYTPKAGEHVRADGNSTVWADGNSTVWADGNSTVWAYGNSTVRADGNSTVRADGNSTVWAYGNSTVRADGNSTVRADGNSTVWADGNSTVWADGNSTVWARSPLAVIIKAAASAVVSGALVVEAFRQSPDPLVWLAAVGATVADGIATLYKKCGPDYETQNGICYTPGTDVEAPDWDGGKAECGGGLHFVSDAAGGEGFRRSDIYPNDRFVACAVRVGDIVVHETPRYPGKVKARRCHVLYECDVNGNRIGSPVAEPEVPA